MNERPSLEIELVLLLSTPRLRPNEVARMRELLHQSLDWNLVFGMLQIHRTAGVAWYNVLQHAIHERRTLKPAYFLKGLEVTFKGQMVMAREQIMLNVALQREFDSRNIRSALLKGSAIGRMAYDAVGMRMFYDNDLLIDGGRLAEIGGMLKELGYVQGSWNYAAGRITPASRAEVLFMAVHSHQTHPYMKPTPETQTLECHRLDLHFSVDLMTGNRTDDIVEAMLDRRVQVAGPDGPPMWTLHQDDMFLLICIHFFKEAIHRNEVLQLKDLVLNKLVDLVALMENSTFPIDMDRLVRRTIDLGLQRSVYFALFYLDTLFPGRLPGSILDQLRPDSVGYLHEVRDGKGPVHRWSSPILDRFFDIYRLKEIPAPPAAGPVAASSA